MNNYNQFFPISHFPKKNINKIYLFFELLEKSKEKK